MIIPQIDVAKTRQSIMEMALIIPSRKMFETILRSIDLMMDDIVDARSEITSEKTHIQEALEKWDETFEAFGMREAIYYQRIQEAQGEALSKVAYQPLLEGKYTDEEDHPDWPDVETPWRLMNSLALIAAESGKKKTYFDQLKERWIDNFSRFWQTCSIILGQASRSVLALQVSWGDGPGQVPESEEESLYDQAAAKAREVVDTVSDFFTGKTVEEAKKTARHVGIGLGVGLFLGVAVAALVFWRIRR